MAYSDYLKSISSGGSAKSTSPSSTKYSDYLKSLSGVNTQNTPKTAIATDTTSSQKAADNFANAKAKLRTEAEIVTANGNADRYGEKLEAQNKWDKASTTAKAIIPFVGDVIEAIGEKRIESKYGDLTDADRNTYYQQQQAEANAKAEANANQVASIIGKYNLPTNYADSFTNGYKAENDIRKDLKAKGISSQDIEPLTEYFTRQVQDKYLKAAQQLAESNPGYATALSVPTQLLAGVRNSLDTVGDVINGRDTDNISKGAYAQNVVDTLRGTVTENIDSNIGKTLYGAGTSAADMLLNLGLHTGPVGMGLEKASSVKNDAIDRGLSNGQVVEEMLASGLTTAITEAIPMGKISKIAESGIAGTGKEFAKNLVKNIGATMLAEGGQEVAEEVADAYADKMIAGNKSAMQTEYQNYISNGMSEEEAAKTVLKNFGSLIVQDFVGGALAGGALGGGAGIVGNIRGRGNTNTNTNTTETVPTVDQSFYDERRSNTERNFEDLINQQRAMLNQEEVARQNEAINNRINEEANANNQVNLEAMLEEARNMPNPEVENFNSGANYIESILNISENADDLAKFQRVRQYIDTINNPDVTNEGYKNSLRRVADVTARQIGDYNARNYVLNYLNGTEYNQYADIPTNPLTENPFLSFDDTQEDLYVPNLDPQISNRTMAESTGLNGNRNSNVESDTLVMDFMPREQRSDTKVREEVPADNNVSQTSLNTFKNSDTFQRSEEATKWLEAEQKAGKHNVDRISEKESVERAAQRLDTNPQYEEENIRLSPGLSGVEQDMSMMLLDSKVAEAERTGDWSKVSEWARVIVDKTHKAAQGLQALAKYTRSAASTIVKTQKLAQNRTDLWAKKNPNKVGTCQKVANALKNINDGTITPQPTVSTREQIRQSVINALSRESSSIFSKFTDADIDYLTTLVENNASTKMIQDVIQQKLATGYMGMSVEDMQEITRLFEEAKKNPNSKESAQLEEQAYELASKYLGSATFAEKWNAWRYLAMLGNPRTHVRNMVGNFVFGTVTNLKDNLAGLMEATVDRLNPNGIERTKSVVTRLTDGDLLKASAKDFDEVAYRDATEGGNKYSFDNEILRARQIFNSKTISKANQANSSALDAEDNFALKNKYQRALAGFLKANGKSADIFSSTNPKDIEFLDKARAYAVNEAKVATFHEDNAVANMLTRISNEATESDSFGVRMLGGVVEGIVPFKRTPANVLKQGVVEYNPVVEMFRTVKDIKNKEGAAKVIDDMAKGFTGSALMALGFALASSGRLRGADDDDWDRDLGEQQYSLNGTGKDGKTWSYTIDWAAPAAIPLFVGAELYSSMQDEGFSGEEVANALASITGPVIEMSMLSGIRDTIQNIAYVSQQNPEELGIAIPTNIALGYASQGVPTLLGQVARSVDDTRRSTYSGNSGTVSNVSTALNKAENKIPFLSMANEPYINVWGDTEENTGGNIVGRLAYNMLSPGYYSDTTRNALESELETLADYGKENNLSGNVFPETASKTFDGKKIDADTYARLSESKGKYTKAAMTSALYNSTYRSMTRDQQFTVMAKIDNFCNALANHDIVGTDTVNSSTYKKTYQAYLDGGMNGAVQFIIDKYSE